MQFSCKDRSCIQDINTVMLFSFSLNCTSFSQDPQVAPVTESYSCLGWKRPWNPTASPAQCSPLNHAPECHIQMFSWKLLRMATPWFSRSNAWPLFPNIQSAPHLAQLEEICFLSCLLLPGRRDPLPPCYNLSAESPFPSTPLPLLFTHKENQPWL